MLESGDRYHTGSDSAFPVPESGRDRGLPRRGSVRSRGCAAPLGDQLLNEAPAQLRKKNTTSLFVFFRPLLSIVAAYELRIVPPRLRKVACLRVEFVSGALRT
jgi:hypothetical protein